MANLKSNTEWSDVYQLEKNDPALAGPGGVMNRQAQSLLNRTEYLKTNKADNAALVAEVKRSKSVEENLQRQITTSTAGVKYFNTLTQLNAFTPGETDPHQAYVFATKKNYIWDGAWQDEGLSVLDEAKKYVDDSVDIFEKNINIFDPTGALKGKYYNYQLGVISDTADTFAAAKLCVIEPNTEYQTPNYYNQQFAFFDENKIYISGMEYVGITRKFTTPSNAKYIGLTVEVEWLDTFMLCKSSEYPSTYVPFTVKLDRLQVQSSQVQGLIAGVKEGLGIYSVNIIDTSKILPGYYINYGSGVISPSNDGYCVAGYYEIKPNTEYQVSKGYVQQFVFYDENYKYISGQATASPSYKFTTPVNAKYIRLTIPNTQLNTIIVAESSVFPSGAYVPYAVQLKDLIVEPNQINDFYNEVKTTVNIHDLNIINFENSTTEHYVNWENGDIGAVAGFVATDFIIVKPNTLYKTDSAYDQQFAFFDENKVYISGKDTAFPTHTFTTPVNAKFARFTIRNTQVNTVMIAESSVFPDSYQPFNVKVAKNLVIDGVETKTTEIWVSADVNDTTAAFTGKNAIQLALDSITDATAKNRYVIRVKKGLYKVDKAKDFIGYLGYPSMILMKNHVDVVGQGEGNTIIWAELPYNDADVGPSADGKVYDRSRYQTVYSYADDSVMKDLTLVAKNIRYTVHIDNPLGANTTHKFKNVSFIFKGDKGSLQCLGIGTSEGEETYIEGGHSHSDKYFAFACHNNIAFTKPSLWSFKGHNFSSIEGKTAIYMQSDGSLLKDKLKLVGCSFGGSAYVLEYVENWLTGNKTLNRDTFDHAEWSVDGYGNEPFLFLNRVAGHCLRFKSYVVGMGVTIRFDTTSSAYPLLIKNNQSNADSSLYLDSREFIDGYIAQDGSTGLAAQAWGCRDISETVYLYDGSGVNYTSLAKRLGDCSTATKILKLNVNGTVNTITFNKNYTSMTNAQILTEMQAQLTNAVVDFYSYGRDYYPTMTDVAETVYNWKSEEGAVQAYIPKGSVVTKFKGTVRLANANDKIYGVALDDIPVMSTTAEGVKKGQGRVLKRGYIYADRSAAHFVLSDNQSPQVGARFSVNNGQLITDANGKISVDIDAGVVSINC